MLKINKLIEVSGLSMDNSVNTGDSNNNQAEERATSKFKTRKNYSDNLRLLGFILNCQNYAISMKEHPHITRLKRIKGGDATLNKFWIVRGQFLFVV